MNGCPVHPPPCDPARAAEPPALVVAGLGILWAAQTTLAACRAIERADSVLFGVSDPWAAGWIRTLSPEAESLPYPEDGRPRAAIYRAMVARILRELHVGRRVCAVFYGSPAILTCAAHGSVRRARQEGFAARMLPGVSFLDCLFSDLGIDPGDGGCQIFEGTDLLLRRRALDVHAHLVIAQIGLIGNRSTFGAAGAPEVQRGLCALCERLAADYTRAHEVVLYEAATHPLAPFRALRLKLAELPDAAVSALSTLYVPPLAPAPSDPAAWDSLMPHRERSGSQSWRAQRARREDDHDR